MDERGCVRPETCEVSQESLEARFLRELHELHVAVRRDPRDLLCRRDSNVQATQRIHQPVFQSVCAREDAAAGNLLHGSDLQAAPLRHRFEEVLIDGAQTGLQLLPLFRREVAGGTPIGGVVACLDAVPVDFQVFPEIRKDEFARDDPNRAGDGAGQGDDAVCSSRNEIATRGRQARHRDHDRFSAVADLGDGTPDRV